MVAFLIGCGVVLSLSASPAVAERIGVSTYHFVYRHGFYLSLAIVFMLVLSMLGLKWIRRFALLGYAGALLLVVLTLLMGVEIKGARRWLNFGFQIQRL